MASFCSCLCGDNEEGTKNQQLASSGLEPIQPTSAPVVTKALSRAEKSAEVEEELPEEIEKGTYDTLIEMGKQLWASASSYLLPEEQDQFNNEQMHKLERMNTSELRDAVVVGKNLKAAEQNVADEESLGKVQRESLNITSGKLKFDGDVFASLLASSLDEETNLVNATRFIEAAHTIPLLMAGLGRTFSFASADLIKKMDVAQTRMLETAKDNGIDADLVTLQDMVERDIKNGTTHAGKKAAGASRTILRLMWFLDFIGALLEGVAKNQDQDLKAICSKVYEDTLAPRHIWILRKAARSGMKLLPPKQVFRKRLGTDKKTEKEESEMLLRWAAEVNKVADVMWEYMKSKDLEELP